MIRRNWLHRVNCFLKGLKLCANNRAGWNSNCLVEDNAHTAISVYLDDVSIIQIKSYIFAQPDKTKKHALLITIVMLDFIVRHKISILLLQHAPSSELHMSLATPLKSVSTTCIAGIQFQWRKTKSACQCTHNKRGITMVGNLCLDRLFRHLMTTNSMVNIVSLD